MTRRAPLLLFLMTQLVWSSYVLAEPTSYWSWLFTFKRQKEVQPVKDQQYLEECGACHFPYPPGLLPEASWKKLLSASALEKHFKENAELDEDVRVQIENYLVKNAADKSRYKRSKKVMSSLAIDQSPIRITEVPYIKEKHEGVYNEIVAKGKRVKSLSNCEQCHQKAKQAIYDDDTVFIPGYGYNTW